MSLDLASAGLGSWVRARPATPLCACTPKVSISDACRLCHPSSGSLPMQIHDFVKGGVEATLMGGWPRLYMGPVVKLDPSQASAPFRVERETGIGMGAN
jgi:hypothetical protein